MGAGFLEIKTNSAHLGSTGAWLGLTGVGWGWQNLKISQKSCDNIATNMNTGNKYILPGSNCVDVEAGLGR